ncbi:MAG: hybrid sensor histidine kinase/response regulator, partial [Thermodesulfobacterium sp.]|nr:hybrid sensor histidine kinase/response regulator [Thermodesulfobacterium sp.]
LENEHEIALVISDCIMPGMKGDELLKRIHALSPRTLNILLTGQANLEEVGNAIKYAKLFRYIAKPWQYDELRLAITEALHSYIKEKKLEEFYEKISENSRELQEQNEALIKLNQQKNDFLSIAAHDLKNPLFVIQGAADFIAGDYEKLSQEKVVEFASMISISSHQMLALLKNILNVNAIESGKMNISLRQVDILPTVRIVVDVYIERAKTKNITLQFQGEEKQYYAFVDNNLVHQILDNLISNAVKYSPHGKNIYVRLLQQESIVRCEVQDEGPGLSEADQQKLFCKFTRLTPEPTAQENSTGLGLFIVKKLVETMNGKVWCQSQLGQGTTFIVEFPVVNSK